MPPRLCSARRTVRRPKLAKSSASSPPGQSSGPLGSSRGLVELAPTRLRSRPGRRTALAGRPEVSYSRAVRKILAGPRPLCRGGLTVTRASTGVVARLVHAAARQRVTGRFDGAHEDLARPGVDQVEEGAPDRQVTVMERLQPAQQRRVELLTITKSADLQSPSPVVGVCSKTWLQCCAWKLDPSGAARRGGSIQTPAGNPLHERSRDT